MSKHLSHQRFLTVTLVLIIINSWLTGCAPQRAPVKSPLPTPEEAMALLSDPRPTPTRADGKPARQAPPPNPKVYVGDITEVTVSSTPGRYSAQDVVWNGQKWTNALVVRDTTTGQEFRLGDDNGESYLGAQTDQYIIWRYDYHGNEAHPAWETGFYAYVLGSGKSITIAQGPDFQWDPEVAGEWIVYTNVQDQRAAFSDLRAHNLATGEDFLVGSNVPYYSSINNYPSGDFYAIQGNLVVWMEGVKEGTPTWAIRVYDLATRTTRTLKVSDVVYPLFLSISGDVVVWWDEFWVGYDLRQDILFGISTTSSGEQNIPQSLAEPVTVRDGHLYWALKVNDQVHHFSAPIIRDK